MQKSAAKDKKEQVENEDQNEQTRPTNNTTKENNFAWINAIKPYFRDIELSVFSLLTHRVSDSSGLSQAPQKLKKTELAEMPVRIFCILLCLPHNRFFFSFL